MFNHFHLLLEVPPIPEGGIPDEELPQRLGVFYSEAQVAEVAKEMEDAAAVRVRYFTDGAVIGSKAFVNAVTSARCIGQRYIIEAKIRNRSPS